MERHNFETGTNKEITPTQDDAERQKHLSAHRNILSVCNKKLAELPVGKDLPRLARKFFLFELQQEEKQLVEEHASPIDTETQGSLPICHANIRYTPIQFIDDVENAPLAELLHALLRKISETLVPMEPFPSVEEFERQINTNDHETITAFLHNSLGESHPTIALLKTSHQTVVINVLFQAREALIKRGLHFKDVRGFWQIFVYFGGPDFVCLAQRRREHIYNKKDPRKLSNFSNISKDFSIFNMLFQIEWEIRIWFDRRTMQVLDITVHLLDVLYGSKPEEEEQVNHPDIAAFAADVEHVRATFANINSQEPVSTASPVGSPVPSNGDSSTQNHLIASNSNTPTVASPSAQSGSAVFGALAQSPRPQNPHNSNNSGRWSCFSGFFAAVSGAFRTREHVSEKTPLRGNME